jgi:molecular chaperone GrpE (heat shock protein)
MWNTDPEEQANITERPEELEPPVNIGVLKQSLAEARTKAEENLAGWQRAQADFSNFRRRLIWTGPSRLSQPISPARPG